MEQAALERLTSAFASECFPGNPLPFLNGIADLVRDRGTDAIKSVEARQMLWVIMAQCYGQCSHIDMVEEWSRLNKAHESREHHVVCQACGGLSPEKDIVEHDDVGMKVCADCHRSFEEDRVYLADSQMGDSVP